MPLGVLSWNVHHRPGEGPRPQRYQRIAEVIRESGAAICCLQEVGPAMRSELPHLLPEYLSFGQACSGERESVPVLIHRDLGRVLEDRTFWLGRDPASSARAWDARHPRCATAVRLALPRGRLAVVSCHLDHRGRQARQRGAGQLAEWAAEHRPCVIAGDLNAGPDTPAYHQLVGPPPLLQDARVHAQEVTGPQHTWSGPGGLLRRRLDHILVDHRLPVVAHHTLCPPRGRRAPSDHLPILVELLLTRARPC